MADTLLRAMVTIPMDSGIPADAVVNTFYFDSDDDPAYPMSSVVDDCIGMLTAFYQAIDGVAFPDNVGSTASVKFYNMRDPEPRVPVDVRGITLTNSTGATLPAECAVCLSFQADAASGLSQARRRGRVYIGPITNVENTGGRPSSGLLTTIANAAAAMENGVLHGGVGTLRTHWSVYSPTTDATSSIDDAFNDVTNGWVDNAFDTQRRRGLAPTTRTTWT